MTDEKSKKETTRRRERRQNLRRDADALLFYSLDSFGQNVYNINIMIILGIDPGLATMGFGVIESVRGTSKVIDYGVVLTPKDERLPVRLALLEEGVKKLTEKFKPDEIALEELFFNNNVTTAINVAQARGVILLTCEKHCGSLYEYTPLQIKQALTGYGRADKRQMQMMVKTFLRLDKIPRPDDAADALAVALTHAQTNRLRSPFGIK